MRKKTTNAAVPSKTTIKFGPNQYWSGLSGWPYQDKEGTLSKDSRGPMGPRTTQMPSWGESVSMSKKQRMAAYEKLRRKNAKKQKPDGYGLR